MGQNLFPSQSPLLAGGAAREGKQCSGVDLFVSSHVARGNDGSTNIAAGFPKPRLEGYLANRGLAHAWSNSMLDRSKRVEVDVLLARTFGRTAGHKDFLSIEEWWDILGGSNRRREASVRRFEGSLTLNSYICIKWEQVYSLIRGYIGHE